MTLIEYSPRDIWDSDIFQHQRIHCNLKLILETQSMRCLEKYLVHCIKTFVMEANSNTTKWTKDKYANWNEYGQKTTLHNSRMVRPIKCMATFYSFICLQQALIMLIRLLIIAGIAYGKKYIPSKGRPAWRVWNCVMLWLFLGNFGSMTLLGYTIKRMPSSFRETLTSWAICPRVIVRKKNVLSNISLQKLQIRL